MLYQACRWLNDVYPLTVFFIYIGLFVLAFILAFLIPAAAILLLIGSIFALLPLVFANHIFKASERALARSSLRRGECPDCAGRVEDVAEDQQVPRTIEQASPNGDACVRCCSACLRAYDRTGACVPTAG